MSHIQTIFLALIQGLTEFLPISSSAHLILPSQLLGWHDQGILFDVCVHFGTLLAVIIYFRKEIYEILVGTYNAILKRNPNEHSKLFGLLILASIPVCIFGYFLKDFIEVYLRSSLVIALSTIVFAFLLWWSFSSARETKTLKDLNWKNAFFIGLFQSIALIPGTSRSGITITAALIKGFDRVSAAKFSFLLSIPVISLAMGYYSYKLILTPNLKIDFLNLLLATSISFLSALICIHFFIKIISKVGMLPFIIYRLILGVFLFLFIGF